MSAHEFHSIAQIYTLVTFNLRVYSVDSKADRYGTYEHGIFKVLRHDTVSTVLLPTLLDRYQPP